MAAIDLTPDFATPLLGYDFAGRDFDGRSASVRDPLIGRALALQVGDAPGLLLVSLDLCLLPDAFAAELREALGAALGWPAHHVILACTHTHSAPWPAPLEENDPAGRLPQLGPAGDTPPAQRYADLLRDRLPRLAVRAAGLLVPVTAHERSLRCELGYNRRVPQDDGGVRMCWNPSEFPDLAPGPSPDPDLSVLELRRDDGRGRFLAVATGLHPVVLGKTSAVLSADFPGAMVAALEACQPGTQALFLQGASGEVQPWLSTQADPHAVERVGRAVAHAADLAAAGSRPLSVNAILVRSSEPTWNGRPLPLTVAQAGDLAIVALPVELFATLGAELRRRHTGPLLLITLANGWQGYWPDRAAFAAGGYEVNAALAMGRKPGDGESLLDAVSALLASV